MSEHFPQPICEQIWNQKYRFETEREDYPNDHSVEDTWSRISHACAQDNKDSVDFYNALEDFKFMPAGRIIAGAGTGRNVTLFNCYVMGTIPDSLIGIMDNLKEAALTMQQGGGIGYDFSTLRPAGAMVQGVESDASGPLTFMDVWDSMCKTIMSAGSRRGAMMATMRCDHPDIFEFVAAKQEATRLRNFNVSVLCTDKFMEAVQNDGPWELHFEGKLYETVSALKLWNTILQSTYDYAEPGVIFIDRINKANNLWYIEDIAATNPCGEQPLPPYGACLLGSLNLVKFVKNPFTYGAHIDYDALTETTATAVRMLDRVIDISNFPLEAQEIEALLKRRMGLGVTGLADVFFMMGHVYGSLDSIELTENIMKHIAEVAYRTSIDLAIQHGPIEPTIKIENRELFLGSDFMLNMSKEIRDDFLMHGIRNSHLLSVAPTGTISMYGGNVSSGIEPIFATEFVRTITNNDQTKREERVCDYAVDLFHKEFPSDPEFFQEWWDKYMVTAQTLEPTDHIRIQAAAQKWVDSSISKTVNCPKEISFEDFKAVYLEAFHEGCKGCTTYRPNDVTGSVLKIDEPEQIENPVEDITGVSQPHPDMRVMSRPDVIDGRTYKLRWAGDAYYVTFNHVVDPEHGWNMPFEIFIATKKIENQAWVAALTRMISAIFQRGGSIEFVADEMKSVYDPKGGEWINGKYVSSLVSLIGMTFEDHLHSIGYKEHLVPQETPITTEPEVEDPFDGYVLTNKVPESCPSCGGFSLNYASGCPVCIDCGYSKCN